MRVRTADRWRAAGFLGVMVGVLVRFSALERWALWADELASFQRAQLPFAEHLRLLRGSHPLYEMFLRGWITPDLTDAGLRLPSAVCGALAVWLTWRLARRISGERGGALASWLLALSPLHLMYSRIARTYALAALLATLSMWALWRWHTGRRWGGWAAYVAVTAAALYANLLMCGVVLGQNLFVLVVHRRDRDALRRWVGAQAAVGLLFGPWLAAGWSAATHFAAGTPYAPSRLGTAARAAYLAFGLCAGETVSPLNPWAVVPAFVGFAGAAGVAGVRWVRRRSALGLFVGAPVAAVFGVGLVFRVASPKHASLVLPLVAVWLAIGLARVRRVRVGVALGALIAGVCLYGDANYYLGREFADASMLVPWRRMAETVRSLERPGDAILFGGRTRADRFGSDRALFERYYLRGGGRARTAYLPDDWRGAIASALRRRGRCFLVLHRDEPRVEIEGWLGGRGWSVRTWGYVLDERLLDRLRGRARAPAPLLKLYLVTGAGPG